MSKLNLTDIASKVADDDKAQESFQQRYPGGHLERSQLGLSKEDRERGYTFLMPRFNRSQEADESWERWAADHDALIAGQNSREEKLIADAIGKREAPQTIEVERQEQRKQKRPRKVGVINDGPVRGVIKV